MKRTLNIVATMLVVFGLAVFTITSFIYLLEDESTLFIEHSTNASWMLRGFVIIMIASIVKLWTIKSGE